MKIQLRKADSQGLHLLCMDLRNRVDAFCSNYSETFLEESSSGVLGKSLQIITSTCIDAASFADNIPTSGKLETVLRILSRVQNSNTDVQFIKDVLAKSFQRLDPEMVLQLALVFSQNSSNIDVAVEKSIAVLHKKLSVRVAHQGAHFLLASYLLGRSLGDHGISNPIDLPEGFVNPSAPEAVKKWWRISKLYSNVTTDTGIFEEFEWIFSIFGRSLAPNNNLLLNSRSGLERWCEKTTEVLNKYDFSELEEDAWAEVYQEYLDPTERQRLGGFYTPPALVEVMLDAVEYFPGIGEADKWVVMDPTCGSGTFLVNCANRLIKWIKVQDSDPKSIIEKYSNNLVANDVHRFAAFLTGINLLFPIIPELAKLKKSSSSSYRVPLQVYSEDFLRCVDNHYLEKTDLFKVKHKVNLIVGNPPWGGVLKGWQGPLYDPTEREALRQQFGNMWNDKVDVYALFLSNILDFLPKEGRLSFLVQSSLLDKDFGKPLRKKISEDMSPIAIIDLSGQGGALFKTNAGGIAPTKNKKAVMVVPLALVMQKHKEGSDELFRVVSTRGSFTTQEQNAGLVASLFRSIQTELKSCELSESNLGNKVKLSGFSLPKSALKDWGDQPWQLDSSLSSRLIFLNLGGVPLLKIMKTMRGATAQGDEIFSKVADQLNLIGYAGDGYYRSLRGSDIRRGCAHNSSENAVYPYNRGGKVMFGVGIENKLNPVAHSAEKKILGENCELTRLVDLRIAQGEIAENEREYARCLSSMVSSLSARRVRDKPMSSSGRLWFEWIWPRKPQEMLSAPKIVAQRITTRPVTGIDELGFLPFDTVIVMIPLAEEFDSWLKNWGDFFGKNLTTLDGMAIVCCWLNSAPMKGLHTIGRIPRPGGIREFTEALSKEIKLPCAKKTEFRKEISEFVNWSLQWQERAPESCFDPLGTEVDNCLRKLGNWTE